MDGNAFINNLYNKINEVFLKNIDDKNKATYSEAYLKYLHSTYDSLFSDAIEGNDYDAIASVCVKKEKIIHLELSASDKQAFLFPDESFVQLQNLSFEIAALARAKKTGERYELSKSKEEYIEKLNSYANGVAPLFKYSAERVLSEALMDIAFVYDDADIQSFRTTII